MKTRWMTAWAVVAAAGVALAAEGGAKPELKDQKAKVSYSLGASYGKFLKTQGFEPDFEIFQRAVKDVIDGKEMAMTDQDMRQVENDFRREARAKAEERRKVEAAKNKKEGDEFLAANKAKEGVKVFPSGLQYKVLTQGTGPTPKTNEIVKAHYRGTFIDGKPFDSSYDRGMPFETSTHAVIKGWTEALMNMKTGSKWMLYVPPDLGYGEFPRGNIPPNSVLVFEMELLEVKPAPTPTPAPQSAPVTSDIIKVPSAEELKKGAKIEVIKPDQLPQKK